ncbi:MAG: NAD(P)/FAD-dependent oxidoreductase [Armatimonadota bacterium]|nr:NAD(P)/FAD-dependent oxidoreductase [bacterium]
MSDPQIAIIGGGPAGLTAAFELAKHGAAGTIIEADSVVGGISRTEERDGYRFDIGGHRFFTKAAEVQTLWDEILPGKMMTRPRLSRIFYDGKFYDYPLNARNALFNMGFTTAAACMISYGLAKAHPISNPRNFEEWVTNQFGAKLYGMFFKAYTEKVWGIPCSEIGADWAAQRIKGLSLGEAVRNAIFGQKSGKVVKTLIDEFRYPPFGPGQLWQACADAVVERGWTLVKNTSVKSVIVENGHVTGLRATQPDGTDIDIACSHVFSSMPLRELVCGIDGVPDDVAAAARSLKYRDFLTVSLVLDAESLFPDNWIYIHSPEVNLGRIQNFKNWSPKMVPDQSKTCLGLEYFCNEGDDVWRSPDDKLVEMAYKELSQINLAGGSLDKGYVVRMPKAYPVYDTGYSERLSTIINWVKSIEGLYCVGRNGQHRYNNMDHSMMTSVIAVRSLVTGEKLDPWSVNEDAEYHETSRQ